MIVARFRFAALVAALLAPPLCARPAVADDSPRGVKMTIVTAEDETLEAPVTGIADGQLQLATEPPRTIALEDITRIDVGEVLRSDATALDLEWLGQDSHDLVQVGGASGGNGVQDMHLRATNLRPVALKQVLIVCRFPGQLRVWRLDTSQSPHWRVAIERDSLATQAEIYIEPAAIDAFGQRFDVTYTYADGVTTKAFVVARTHTSDKEKLVRNADGTAKTEEPAAPASTPVNDGKYAIALSGGDHLGGKLVGITSEQLVVDCGWGSEVEIPLLRVKGLLAASAASADARGAYERQLAAPAAGDVVFVLAPDNSVARIEVSVEGIKDDKLIVTYQGAERQINRQRVVGIVLAAHPPLDPPSGVRQVFRLASGDELSGRWVGLDGDQIQIETQWSTTVRMPVARVGQIRIRGGKVTSLADLEPVGVEETAYFGRVMHWVRDSGFDGPAQLRGKQPQRSLSMHSRCALTYDLNGEYGAFKATLGFDDSAGALGSVHCRVLVDGRAVLDKAELQSKDDPLPVDIDLSGARQMTLLVDFGANEDVGDRVLWAEPRLFRAAQKAEAQPAGQASATP